MEGKIHENSKSMVLAKTLKIVILRRENAYFQEIEDQKQRKQLQKCSQNLELHLESVLEGVLGGCWETKISVSRPKTTQNEVWNT